MGKVFYTQFKFNDYEGKYSYPNWNQALISGNPEDLKNLEYLVKSNFYCLMNYLLEFKPHPETMHPWVPVNSRHSDGL